MIQKLCFLLLILNTVFAGEQELTAGIYTTADGVDRVKVAHTDNTITLEYIGGETTGYKGTGDETYYNINDNDYYIKVTGEKEFYMGNTLGEFLFIYNDTVSFEYPEPDYEEGDDRQEIKKE